MYGTKGAQGRKGSGVMPCSIAKWEEGNEKRRVEVLNEGRKGSPKNCKV